jgi:methyl-accepting chemotaxis protein
MQNSLATQRPAGIGATAPQARPPGGLIEFFRHHGIWAPGVRLFRRLNFRAKALLITLVFVLPLVCVFSIYLPTAQAELRTAGLERKGVTELQAWLPMLRALIDVRNASRLVLGGADFKDQADQAYAKAEQVMREFDKHLTDTGDSLQLTPTFAKLKAEWASAAPASRQPGASPDIIYFGKVAELAKVITEDIVQESGLTLDPQADSFYTVSALALKMPGLVEDIGQMRAWSVFLLGRNDIKGQRRFAASATMVAYQTASLRGDIGRAVAANPALKDALDLKVLDAIAPFQALASKAALDGQASDPKQLWSEGTVALDGAFRLLATGVPALVGLVDARLAHLTMQRNVQLLVLTLCMMLATYLFYCFFLVTQGGLREVQKHLESMTAGDLTTQPKAWGGDEAANLMGTLANMQASLRAIVSRVRLSSDAIVVASSEVASASQDLSARTEHTAANLEQSASSIEEIAATIKNTAGSSVEAAGVAGSNSQAAERGASVIAQVVGTMQDIQTSSAKISEIIGVIDGIAFQTNILALNAAVEAARAGAEGRGFAVVASEVRNLAKRSAEAAREIKTLITSSVERVESGTRVVQGAGTIMGELQANAQRMTGLLTEISTAASEQSDGVSQVSIAVQDLDQMTQQNAALVEQSAAAADSLKAQAQDLAAQVAMFRLPG